MHFSLTTIISLAPGFSPVWDKRTQASRFNGFSAIPKAAKAAAMTSDHTSTGLKPGANERIIWSNDFQYTP
jgi:hypothetical protein